MGKVEAIGLIRSYCGLKVKITVIVKNTERETEREKKEIMCTTLVWNWENFFIQKFSLCQNNYGHDALCNISRLYATDILRHIEFEECDK